MPHHASHRRASGRLHAPARGRFSAFTFPVLAFLIALTVGFLGVRSDLTERDRAEAAALAARCSVAERAELVPAAGALFGVNLDLEATPLAEYAKGLGHKPAVSVSFTDFPYDEQGWANLEGAAEQIRASGQMMLLTLEPHQGLGAVTEKTAGDLAADLALLNSAGVPVVVRFAHEMNGSWYPWSQRPAEYVAAFRRMAEAVHAKAPGSAMMWAPNYGGGYPFPAGEHTAQPSTVEFSALDTDTDGTLSAADDPYAPYYPGDDAVDWVGMSIYHWGSQHPWGENELPETDKFVQQLAGTYSGANGDDSAVPDFYAVYGHDHDKPVAIPETAALFAPGGGGADELALKQAWWEQVFAPGIAEQFPQIRMVNWFEWSKQESEVAGQVDWTSTGTPRVRKAFTEALPAWLRYGPDTSCTPSP